MHITAKPEKGGITSVTVTLDLTPSEAANLRHFFVEHVSFDSAGDVGKIAQGVYAAIGDAFYATDTRANDHRTETGYTNGYDGDATAPFLRLK